MENEFQGVEVRMHRPADSNPDEMLKPVTREVAVETKWTDN